MKRKVCTIRHIPCETLGTIADVLEAEGIAIEGIRTFDQQPVPADMAQYDGLIVMGGPMGVYEQERHPHLQREITLIEAALREKKPILGVCLGSQLLAAALGAPVTKGKQKEIGWYPVTLTPQARHDPLWRDAPPSFTAYIWHGDIFALPRGAVSLASSELTEHQAFRYGPNAYGILFHMEITSKIIGAMTATFANELRNAAVDVRSLVEKTARHLPPLRRIGQTVFQRWARLVKQVSF